MSYGEADSYQGAQQPKPDASEVTRYAKQHADYNDDSDEENGVFSQAFHHVMGREDEHTEVNEEEVSEVTGAHDRIYNQNNGQPSEENTSRDLGSAAAMQAFKMFSGGGGNGGSSQLIGLAMGEAQKLMSAQGGGGNVNQAEMLQTAATMAMKLLMTQQKSANGSGGSMDAIMSILGSLGGAGAQKQESGGLSGMLGKFL
ncbi:hypothetical protein BY458DRAFT_521432 [Sporodiniella umbellata]|nr:hypothetical protein BY458DRAFT_521432 [Sporodiniella umbellata]